MTYSKRESTELQKVYFLQCNLAKVSFKWGFQKISLDLLDINDSTHSTQN